MSDQSRELKERSLGPTGFPASRRSLLCFPDFRWPAGFLRSRRPLPGPAQLHGFAGFSGREPAAVHFSRSRADPPRARRQGIDDERQIRAVVLALPTERSTAEALWTVHDRVRYLWMLKDGHFLLRDRDGLEQGDATLEPEAVLHFLGRCCGWRWIPVAAVSGDELPGAGRSRSQARRRAQPAHRRGQHGGGRGEATAWPDFVVRILRRESGR